MNSLRNFFAAWLAAAAVIGSPVAQATYSNLFVFGDSLSDSGNNAVALAPNVTPVPISGNTFIPTFPYASGHYTNGQVWAQTFASALGLAANPLLLGGTDYAFGGARTGPVSGNLLNPFPPSQLTQVATFLAHVGVAPGDALYVLTAGGNNLRDALTDIAGCNNNAACIQAIMQSTVLNYVTNEATALGELEAAGARHIVLWDVPDAGKGPAIIAQGAQAAALASLLANEMNAALLATIGGDPNVRLFDLFALQDSWVANPAAFGLTNVTDACAQFVNCNPSTYMFWDGIHPTSGSHALISNAMLTLVPEPATLVLLGLGLAGLAATRRRRLGTQSRA